MASTGNMSFCSDYMILKPEQADLLELCKLLFKSDISERKFLELPEGIRQEPFQQRWIIFVSILAQLFFRAIAKPLAWIGVGIEFWLNLISSNGGSFRLVLNALRGRVICPPGRSSARFLSFIGYTDKRHNLLDYSKTVHGDDNLIRTYYAFVCIMTSKIAYENKNYVQTVVKDDFKMDFIGFFNFWNDYEEKATTETFLLEDNNMIIVSFRGTEPFNADNWISDVDLSWLELLGIGRIHVGFMRALGLQKNLGLPKEQPDDRPETAYYGIRKILKERLEKNDNMKFIVTGHSLGGALAILFPAILALHEESWLLDRLEGVYTFGQPRVGDPKFGEFMNNTIEKHGIDYRRVVYSFDIVPRVPFDDSLFMYKHFGRICIYYNSFYIGKVLNEEPDRNYFTPIWLIPRILTGWWELIRSFIITYTKGPYYREEPLLQLLRIFGLIFPGITDHIPKNYVDSVATTFESSQTFSLN